MSDPISQRVEQYRDALAQATFWSKQVELHRGLAAAAAARGDTQSASYHDEMLRQARKARDEYQEAVERLYRLVMRDEASSHE